MKATRLKMGRQRWRDASWGTGRVCSVLNRICGDAPCSRANSLFRRLFIPYQNQMEEKAGMIALQHLVVNCGSTLVKRLAAVTPALAIFSGPLSATQRHQCSRQYQNHIIVTGPGTASVDSCLQPSPLGSIPNRSLTSFRIVIPVISALGLVKYWQPLQRNTFIIHSRNITTSFG